MIGILAYGSLIDDPGEEIGQLTIERLDTTTPFKVEFKRKSAKRNNAPTLIPVENGGNKVPAKILVLNESVTLRNAQSMLWRREVGITDTSKLYSEPVKPSVNSVIVKQLSDIDGIATVLYTSIGQNIDEPVTAAGLANYAINSILDEAGKAGQDGVRYLSLAHKNGIRTELSEAYEKEILRRAQCDSLNDAIILFDNIREGVKQNNLISRETPITYPQTNFSKRTQPMHISKIAIKNFRLLKDVSLSLEKESTVIVGRNNSGKTSLTEIFRRLLSETGATFSLEDFSIASISGFEDALKKKIAGVDESIIRTEIPFIEMRITISYEPLSSDLGPLSDFVIDLKETSTDAIIVLRYQLKDGKIDALFEGCTDASKESVLKLVKSLKKKIPQLFSTVIFAEDPTDATNISVMEYAKFKTLLGAGFINAQRGLDDITHTEKDVLGKVLSKIFKTANSDSAPEEMRLKSAALEGVVSDIQTIVDTEFNKKVDDLLPALKLFGYPGLSDPNLSTETTLNTDSILDRHTRIRYNKGNGIYLPETYNGLGSRNLIYMLFQLFEFFRDYQTKPVTPGVYIVFIEEPEAHLHPQMQEVFIKQINEIALEFAKTLNGGKPWPVQFVVSTHSTHVANEASFESIRYFLTTRKEQVETRVKDLRLEFSDSELKADKEFLHKYLTLTRCDLFFADKAILIEGPTERILMPKFIEKLDEDDAINPKLSSQYVSVIEVGGAYMHHFYKFLDFLELKTLIITDLDSVKKTQSDAGKTTYPACEVSDGTHTSNAGNKNWFNPTMDGYLPLSDFISKTESEKIVGLRRIAFQIPEATTTACGRSFEDAFILANSGLFTLVATAPKELATEAYNLAEGIEKTDFALEYALEKTTWEVPLYIKEGLTWLSKNPDEVVTSETTSEEVSVQPEVQPA